MLLGKRGSVHELSPDSPCLWVEPPAPGAPSSAYMFDASDLQSRNNSSSTADDGDNNSNDNPAPAFESHQAGSDPAGVPKDASASVSTSIFSVVKEPSLDLSKEACAFNQYGMCVVKGLVSKSVAKKAYVASKSVYDDVIKAVEGSGTPNLGIGTKNGYYEIVQRTKGRYEINFGMNKTEFLHPEFVDNKWLKHFFSNVFDKSAGYTLARQSILISFPNAHKQQWHVDGGHISSKRHLRPHAINVFVALCDITPEMGPTEIRPASHFLTRNLTSMMLAARARKQLHAPVQPALKAGDALIFDYRTLHRGTLHKASKPRALLELVFYKNGFVDILNFPRKSLFAAAAAGEDG